MAEQIAHVKGAGDIEGGPSRVLVIGASGGYGLASRITAAFGSGASTIGVFFERPSERGRTASPGWYKSDAYRARAVREPRKVLAEFDVTLPKGTSVRVWDSTAEIRYLVLPMRPEGTDGMSEDELASLVTRDSMIGTGFPRVAS